MVHRFFFTICSSAMSGVSPVPHATFFWPFAGVVRSFKWKLAMRSWNFAGTRPDLARGDEVPEVDVRHVAL